MYYKSKSKKYSGSSFLAKVRKTQKKQSLFGGLLFFAVLGILRPLLAGQMTAFYFGRGRKVRAPEPWRKSWRQEERLTTAREYPRYTSFARHEVSLGKVPQRQYYPVASLLALREKGEKWKDVGNSVSLWSNVCDPPPSVVTRMCGKPSLVQEQIFLGENSERVVAR